MAKNHGVLCASARPCCSRADFPQGYDAIRGNVAASILVVFALIQFVGYVLAREFIAERDSGQLARLERRLDRYEYEGY